MARRSAVKSLESVECDVCRRTVPLNDINSWWAVCDSEECGGRLLLTPCPENMRYSRTNCKNTAAFFRFDQNIESFRCHCCNEEFSIGKCVIEIRCGQLVYNTIPKIRLDEQLKNLNGALMAAQCTIKVKESHCATIQSQKEMMAKDKEDLSRKVELLEKELKGMKKILEAKDEEVKTLRTIAMNMSANSLHKQTNEIDNAIKPPFPTAKRPRVAGEDLE